jgi:hypothetical protein
MFSQGYRFRTSVTLCRLLVKGDLPGVGRRRKGRTASPQISRVNTERRAHCGLDSCTSDTSASDVQPFSKVLVKQFVELFPKTAAGCSGVAGISCCQSPISVGGVSMWSLKCQNAFCELLLPFRREFISLASSLRHERDQYSIGCCLRL